MELNRFISKVPYLYHLTDRRNMQFIEESKRLYSTVILTGMSGIVNGKSFLETKRPNHVPLTIGNNAIWIRDQQPITAAMDRSLTHNWTREQYIHLLNSRVFFWPDIKRLINHYTRYRQEDPIILKISVQDALNLNPHAELCRLNSGATRCSSHHNGNPPPRGPESFLPISQYNEQNIAEVTFPGHFDLPSSIFTSNRPDGIWTLKNL